MRPANGAHALANAAPENTAPETIVIAATPTPNGDLHVGHLAGPYLAGDIYTRHLRAQGRNVTYATCTDDSQTYVIPSARKRGIEPQQLCAESTRKIQLSLDAMGIDISPLPEIDDAYRSTVLEFMTSLHEAGRFETRTVRLPYAERAGTYLFDGLVKGECPVCLAGSCGGGCENCGHPNHFDQLGNPRSVLDETDPVTLREVNVLVLALEKYRGQLIDYFAERRDRWRPRSRQLIDELLANPLPEVPVTVPDPGWGIPAPFAPEPGQIIYPWLEAMPASIHATHAARDGMDEQADGSWHAGRGTSLVYFHGFDNVYFWGLVDLVMLLAHGDRYIVPDANICNEFYELEHQKFSTSRNHLIWGADLIAEVPRDSVRFYLALTGPENQRTNFSRAEMSELVRSRLTDPWNGLADSLDHGLRTIDPTQPLEVTATGRSRANAIHQGFQQGYDLASFSPARAADMLVTQLGRLRDEARAPDDCIDCGSFGDMLLSVRTVLACAAPILIDAAAEALRAGVDLDPRAHRDCRAINAFRLPRLATAKSMRGGTR